MLLVRLWRVKDGGRSGTKIGTLLVVTRRREEEGQRGRRLRLYRSLRRG